MTWKILRKPMKLSISKLNLSPLKLQLKTIALTSFPHISPSKRLPIFSIFPVYQFQFYFDLRQKFITTKTARRKHLSLAKPISSRTNVWNCLFWKTKQLTVSVNDTAWNFVVSVLEFINFPFPKVICCLVKSRNRCDLLCKMCTKFCVWFSVKCFFSFQMFWVKHRFWRNSPGGSLLKFKTHWN